MYIGYIEIYNLYTFITYIKVCRNTSKVLLLLIRENHCCPVANDFKVLLFSKPTNLSKSSNMPSSVSLCSHSSTIAPSVANDGCTSLLDYSQISIHPVLHPICGCKQQKFSHFIVTCRVPPIFCLCQRTVPVISLFFLVGLLVFYVVSICSLISIAACSFLRVLLTRLRRPHSSNADLHGAQGKT